MQGKRDRLLDAGPTGYGFFPTSREKTEKHNGEADWEGTCSQTTTQNLEDVAVTPASTLGSTRDKPDVEYCLNMFKVMQAHDIRYFFYIGGNDSSDTCRIVNEQARLTDYAEGNEIIDAFITYCRLLTGELPTQDRLQAPAVAKIINNK